jgi:lysophospholipase L1-like esterase
MTIGSQRFRADSDYALRPQSGERIAVLGDSFTFGAGVNDDETYPRVLAQAMKQRGRDTEVINAGVPGLGTGEEAVYLRDWVQRFHPAIVVLTVAGNDPANDAERQLFVLQNDGTAVPHPTSELAAASERLDKLRRVNSLVPFRFLCEHSELYSLLRRTISSQMRRGRGQSLESVATSSAPADATRLTAGELGWLNQQVALGGGRLFVVFFPSLPVVHPERYVADAAFRKIDQEVAASLARSCARLNIPFADMTVPMQQEAKRTHTLLYYEGADQHPNATGYRTFARLVADFLAEKEGAPPSADLKSQDK